MNPKEMKLSEKGLEFIKTHEGIKGFNPKTGLYMPYDDGYGIKTIGYGHKIQRTEKFDEGINEKHVHDLFKQDLHIAENVVKNYIDSPINQNQFDAIVSLAYNIGKGSFEASTIRQYINNTDFKSNKYQTPEHAWKTWNKSQGQVSKGLINRRKDEWDLYENGNYQISTAG